MIIKKRMKKLELKNVLKFKKWLAKDCDPWYREQIMNLLHGYGKGKKSKILPKG